MTYLRLRHHRADGDYDIYHLRPGRRYLMGRGSDCDIRVLDLKLSRHHSAIENQGNHWTVVDLNGRNGTLLDDTKVLNPQRITQGQVITIGGSSFDVLGLFASLEEDADCLVEEFDSDEADEEYGFKRHGSDSENEDDMGEIPTTAETNPLSTIVRTRPRGADGPRKLGVNVPSDKNTSDQELIADTDIPIADSYTPPAQNSNNDNSDSEELVAEIDIPIAKTYVSSDNASSDKVSSHQNTKERSE